MGQKSRWMVHDHVKLKSSQKGSPDQKGSIMLMRKVFTFGLAFVFSATVAFADQRGVFVPQKSRTLTTQPFGSGTSTRSSDGYSSQTNKFGNGAITRERDSQGHQRTGTTQPFGPGTITRRSDGSSSQTNKFGSGTITRESPGRSAFGTNRKK